MSSPSEGLALNSFKILTPKEIEILLKKGKEAKKFYGMEDSEINANSIFGAEIEVETEYRAKIIPINAKARKKKTGGGEVFEGNLAKKLEEINVEEEYENLPSGDLEKIGILSWDKIKNLKEKQRIKEENALPSSTAFLLDAIKTTKKSNQKINNSKAISTYKATSKARPTNKNPDEKVVLGDKGVLINKDQH